MAKTKIPKRVKRNSKNENVTQPNWREKDPKNKNYVGGKPVNYLEIDKKLDNLEGGSIVGGQVVDTDLILNKEDGSSITLSNIVNSVATGVMINNGVDLELTKEDGSKVTIANVNPPLTITGEFLGSSSTFAGLPTPSNSSSGDFAILIEKDGSNERGVYLYDGSNFQFITFLDEKFTLPISSKGDLLTHDGTEIKALTLGTNGQILKVDSTQANGLKWVDDDKLLKADFEKYYKFQNWKNMISGGGVITWENDNLSTSRRFIVIPTSGRNAYININLNNLVVPDWNVAYIDLTDAQLSQSNLSLSENDFTVESYQQYTEATTQNRFVLGYKNADNGKFIFSNGQTVDSMNYYETPWIDATYENGWITHSTTYSHARYKRIGNVVHIDGLVKDGTNNNAIFRLPVGFRPSKRLIKTSMHNNGSFRLDVLTDGRVLPIAGGTTWVSINLSFAV